MFIFVIVGIRRTYKRLTFEMPKSFLNSNKESQISQFHIQCHPISQPTTPNFKLSINFSNSLVCFPTENLDLLRPLLVSQTNKFQLGQIYSNKVDLRVPHGWYRNQPAWHFAAIEPFLRIFTFSLINVTEPGHNSAFVLVYHIRSLINLNAFVYSRK